MPRQKKTVEREDDVIAIEQRLWIFLLSCEKWDEHKYQLIAALNKGIGKAMVVKNNYASSHQDVESAQKFVIYAKAIIEMISLMKTPYKEALWCFLLKGEISKFVDAECLPIHVSDEVFIGENIFSSFYSSKTQTPCYKVSREHFERARFAAIKCLEEEVDQIKHWKMRNEKEKKNSEQICIIDGKLIHLLMKGDIEKNVDDGFSSFFWGDCVNPQTKEKSSLRLNFCFYRCNEVLINWLLSKNGDK